MSALGALFGLFVAIFFIIKKISPAYSLILGAIVGGLLGGFTLPETIFFMIEGIKDVSPAIIRILTAGVLTGVLIKTGAAESISNSIINKLGEGHMFLAIALATFLLTAIGVFIDVAIITVAPIALSIGRKMRIPKATLLIVMIGGGKCGNIVSPNPNTIIAAENFGADLSSVMFVNLIPAIIGLIFTVYIITRLMPSGSELVEGEDVGKEQKNLPSFAVSMVAPIVTILLLSSRPLLGINIDPLVALPAGGLMGVLAMRDVKLLREGMTYGLQKMTGIAILLVGTGTIAGIIKASTIKDVLLETLSQTDFGDFLIAPLSGVLMGAATASSTAGATIASSSFAETILAAGITAVWGAAMVNAGSTVLDHLPHGSFFHATGGVMNLQIKKRLKLVPYETAVGFILTAGSILVYLLTQNF